MKASYSLYLLSPKHCHCNNTGLVMMDDRGQSNNSAEPCPMCVLGSRRSSEFVSWRTQHPPRIDPKNETRIIDDGYDRLKPNSSWKNRDGKLISSANYYAQVAVDQLTWNGGMNVFQRFQCATYGCTFQGFVDDPLAECDACAPTPYAQQNVPKFRDIVKAIVLKKKGDPRQLTEIAISQIRQLEAVDNEDRTNPAQITGDAA